MMCQSNRYIFCIGMNNGVFFLQLVRKQFECDDRLKKTVHFFDFEMIPRSVRPKNSRQKSVQKIVNRISN